MSRPRVAAIALLAAVAVGACRNRNPGRITPALSWVAHTTLTTPFDDTTADDLVRNANFILDSDDPPGDAPCPIGLSRRGAVAQFSVGTGIINNQREMWEVLNFVPNVKMVRAINWCFGPGNFAGCARQPGTTMAIAHPTGSQHIVLAHEYGHGRDIGHNPSAGFIMATPAQGNNVRVTAAECGRYQ